ncbi:MAG: LarC family nickel insertion protein, partial [Oscillospiraceae bacterium]|nr:LarC family nickel insertion protein [Oscillospiraceae bacterium]
MKTIYLECAMGASGDMLLGALSALLPDQAAFVRELGALGIPGVTVTLSRGERCGVQGAQVRVLVDGEEEHSHDHHDHHDDCDHDHESHHAHHGMADIRAIVSALPVPDAVKQDAMAVYAAIADAESRVHGCPVEQIHFHEVGAMDAVADITGVCLALHRLAPAQVLCSPVHVGSGQVRCAHGILPVPAPATSLLLTGIPCYGGSIAGELCTPTGAALLRQFVTRFGPMPVLTTETIG